MKSVGFSGTLLLIVFFFHLLAYLNLVVVVILSFFITMVLSLACLLKFSCSRHLEFFLLQWYICMYFVFAMLSCHDLVRVSAFLFLHVLLLSHLLFVILPVVLFISFLSIASSSSSL